MNDIESYEQASVNEVFARGLLAQRQIQQGIGRVGGKTVQ